MQSAYRRHHSTETALLKVKNDLLLNMNRQHVTLLVLLDLSSAFDTVDHAILLNRLESLFGISETVLSWFKSYLSDRKQYVSVDGVSSSDYDMKYGVPKDLALDPFFSHFTLVLSLNPSKNTYLTTKTVQLDHIHQSTRYSPSSSLLQDLHWLPIKYRCIFKILLITFKAIYGHAPSYFQDLVKVKHQTRTLRSSTATYLDYPSIKSSNNLGERPFYIAAPTEWNRLPANIRNSPSLDVFKKRLKTHLFTKDFDT